MSSLKLPLRAVVRPLGLVQLVDNHGVLIADMEVGPLVEAEEAQEHANEIVHRVNCHDALVEALKGMIDAFTAGTAEQHTYRLTAIAALKQAQAESGVEK